MPAHVKMPALDTALAYVVGGSPQSVFAITFPFWTASDIVVLVGGIELPSVDYTVAGSNLQDGSVVVGAYGSGTVTLATPVSNTTVTIDRFIVAERLTDFSSTGPITNNSQNSDLDKLTGRDQDLKRTLGRTVRAPRGDVLTELPGVTARAGQFLAFDGAGNPAVAAGTGSDSNLRTDLANSASGASLLAYIAAGVSAIIRTVMAKLRDQVNVADYGAVGDGSVDDLAAILATIAAHPGKRIHLGASHQLSAPLPLTKPTKLVGLGFGRNNPGAATNYGTRIFTNAVIAQLIQVNVTTGGGNDDSGGSIEGIILDGNAKAVIGLQVTGANSVKWRFEDINAVNSTSIGIDVAGNHSHRFINCQAAVNGSNNATDAGWRFSGANAINCFGCNSEANRGHGVLTTAGYSNMWNGGAIEGNQLNGVLGNGTAQHLSLWNLDFEANGAAAPATYFDIEQAVVGNSYWSLKNLKFAGTNTASFIKVRGDQTYIENCRGLTANKILWTATAISGALKVDCLVQLDPASVLVDVNVINTRPAGLGFTTPAVGASTVAVTNSVLNGPVEITFTNPGTVTSFTITQPGTGGSLTIANALAFGQKLYLAPGDTIAITYSVVPTWRWRPI